MCRSEKLLNGADGPLRSSFAPLKASIHALQTFQPLNELADNMKPSRSSKTNIKLSIGDPAVDGNLVVPDVVNQELIKTIEAEEHNGYPPTCGYDEVRQGVAEYTRRFCSTPTRKASILWKNVIMTSGVSHAIVLGITALCNPGDNILVGAPSFPHYKTVCDSFGIECRFYPLLPDRNWQCDLEAASRLVDDKTRGMVIINPSNPCGSNFSRAHVEDIIHFCERHQLPLISDEIYAELVFHGQVFTSVADIDSNVPRLILSGIAKCLAAPGWRIGWTVLIDPNGVAEQWQRGMDNLAQLICGPNSLCQVAVARSLLLCPRSYTDDFIAQLERGAEVYAKLLDANIGLLFDKPCASMFVMIHVDFTQFKDIKTDIEFYEKLLDEENVQVLPGSIFGVSGFVRATVSRPPSIIAEAVDRIIQFCVRHRA